MSSNSAQFFPLLSSVSLVEIAFVSAFRFQVECMSGSGAFVECSALVTSTEHCARSILGYRGRCLPTSDAQLVPRRLAVVQRSCALLLPIHLSCEYVVSDILPFCSRYYRHFVVNSRKRNARNCGCTTSNRCMKSLPLRALSRYLLPFSPCGFGVCTQLTCMLQLLHNSKGKFAVRDQAVC